MRVIAVALLLLVPVASAGSAPTILFFADAEQGPVGEGVLTQEWPTSNESSVRPVTMELVGPSQVFIDIEEPPGTHLRGQMFAGLWPEAGAATDSQLKIVVFVDGEAVSEGLMPVHIDPEDLPDPMLLIPPDPTDPEGAVYHAVGQILPLIYQPPTMVDLGMIDMEVPNGSEVKVGLSLVGADGGPPTGAGVLMKYDGALTPSFVYMPWWSPDPEAVSPQVEQAQPSEPTTKPPAGGSDDDDAAPAASPGEDSPGLGLVALLAAVGAALVLRRR